MKHIIKLLILFVFIQTLWITYLLVNPKVEIKTEIKEVVVEIEKEPTYVYNVTSEEREMLARIVYLESNIESIECQKAVVSVVINRWLDGYFGNTLHDVVYAKNQFTPSNQIYKTTPTKTNYEAVDYVLRYGCTIPEYVKFFRADYHFNWDGYVQYKKIDHTCFGYFNTDKQ